MAVSPLADLVQELSAGPLLSAERRQELSQLRASFSDARALARELVKRGWLTPYQVNQLVQGRGHELVLGPYVLLERLGEGGMGTVFKAHHTFLKRPVAIKLISQAQLSSTAAAERFLLEMQLAAHLDHPHIVRALDAGQVGDRYYLAMELIQGVTLSRLVEQRGPLPVPWACACVRQAALGLQHASESGLVHRDIKPSNLMLSTLRGSPPTVKVLDLGLARLQRAEGGRDLTRTGTVMGTMDYLAPEQALDPRGVDVRADIYSLGCTFFFLLTGRPPFHGGTEAQRLLQHQQQEAPAVESLRPDVPPALSAVVRRMLAKRPEQRFATPGEVAAVLEPFASWAGWESVAPTTGIATGTSTGGSSLIDNHAAAGERGWTLLADATRISPPAPPTGAGPAPAPIPTVIPPSSYSIVLPAPSQPATPAAPSLVTNRAAAPEKGWTLLTEPEPLPVAVPVAALVEQPGAVPVTPTRASGERGPSRRTWVLIAAVAAALLLLVGGVLLARSWFASSPPDIVAVKGPDKGGGNPPPIDQQNPQPVKQKQPEPENPKAVKGIRPVVIKPNQPMSFIRNGDLVFSAYPGGYIGMADRDDRDTLQVWDLTTMKVVHRFTALSGMEEPRALSTDGRWLAGRVGNRIRICHVDEAGKEVLGNITPSHRPERLRFAGPDRLVTLRHEPPNRGVELWDLKTTKLVLSLPLPGGCDMEQAAVSPDGKLLVVPHREDLLMQELREGASATIRALPQPRRPPFHLRCSGLSFALDGNSLTGVFNEPFDGWRVVRWDVRNGILQGNPSADYPFPKTIILHEAFYGGPRIECLPGQGGWLLFGQTLVDGTGKAHNAFARGSPFNHPIIRALTAQYLVECAEREVRIIPVPQPKGP
jgi:serine/threonine-protein kinase